MQNSQPRAEWTFKKKCMTYHVRLASCLTGNACLNGWVDFTLYTSYTDDKYTLRIKLLHPFICCTARYIHWCNFKKKLKILYPNFTSFFNHANIGGRCGIIRKRGYGTINLLDESRGADDIGGKRFLLIKNWCENL